MRLKIITLSIVGFLLLASAGLSACSNTVDGFGRDMEKAGEKIQGAARK